MLLVLAGCHGSDEPSLLVNLSNSPIVVRYLLTRHEISPGQWANCSFDAQRPRVAPGIATRNQWRDLPWRDVDTSAFDRKNCGGSIEIPPRSTAWIESFGACDDYEEGLASNPTARPTIRQLAIVSDNRTIQIEDWEVARAFKKRGHTCIFEFGTV